MKKEYIQPRVECRKVQPLSILAGSLRVGSAQTGGQNAKESDFDSDSDSWDY